MVFHDKVPVPELWNRLGTVEKSAISDQLSQITETMRRLEQDHSHQFIGSINRQRLRDYVLMSQLLAGPSPSIKEFNDWLACPSKCLLPDDGEIKFTHAELDRQNIIVSSFTPVQIAIVNWQQAGWYPNYWEYCKAFYTCWDGKWRKDYVDKVLQPRTDAYTAFSDYCMAMGTD